MLRISVDELLQLYAVAVIENVLKDRELAQLRAELEAKGKKRRAD